MRIKTLSVSELNQYVKRLFHADPILNQVQVAGEVSNCTYHNSGHIYFSMKDEHSRIRCVMFKNQAQFLKIKLKNGMRVMVAGSVSVYERDGQYQIYAARIEETGIGEWFLAFQQLKEKLEAEGLLDAAKKKKLPGYPETIGLITSETGAALHDFLTVLYRRWPSAKLFLFPAVVQGELAPGSLTRAVKRASTYPLDVILLGRGGGSIEELWAFNSESLAYAMSACPIPIITGVGHETDFTIADFVADRRANTPTAAAELAVPDHRHLTRQLDSALVALKNKMRNRVREEKRALKVMAGRTPLRFPTRFIDERRQALDEMQHQLFVQLTHRLKDQKLHLTHAAEKLHQLSPLSVISRGYAVVQDRHGNVAASVHQLSVHDEVTVRLKDGLFRAGVNDIEEGDQIGEKKVL